MTGATLVIAVVQATLTGVVRDSLDLQPIVHAHITVAPVGGETAVRSGISDRFGAFVVPGVSADGPVRVEVRAFGYEVRTRSYTVGPAEPIRVLLSPAPVGLAGIEVSADGRSGDPLSFSRDAFVIDSTLIRSLPTILETDVLRASTVSPSASAASDYASVPFIRGGTSDGTPVMLDGVRLFNAFHLGGFISAVNAEVVDRASVIPGSSGNGFAFGSLSGAIDIATRDGSRDRNRMAGSLGLASSRLSLEGPIGANASYLVDGRRTYIDGLTLALRKLGVIEGRAPYFFHDLHAKVTADLGGVRRMSVSGYVNSESAKSFDEAETMDMSMRWGNAAFSAHYRDGFGANGIIDASLGHSRFTSDLFALGSGGGRKAGDSIVDHTAPADTLLFGGGSMGETRAEVRATWYAGRVTLTAGTQAIRFATDQDHDVDDDWDDLENFFSPVTVRARGWRLAAFSQVGMPLARGFSTRAGVRVDRFPGLATTLAPFAEVGYASSWWTARLSASRSHQALASVRNEEALAASFLAYDLLVPVDEAPVPRNTEFSIGWETSREGLRVRVDAYARRLDHLRLPDPGLEGSPIEGRVLGDPSKWEVASGAARGIEASWSWMWDRRVSLLGSYRWASVSRTVGSRTYTPRFHRKHELELGSSYSRGGSSWSARVSLRSGQPVTQVFAIVPVTLPWPDPNSVIPDDRDEFVTLGGEYNSAMLPHYARIDVGWRRESEVSWFGGGSVVPYASVVNLFSLPNVVGWRAERKDFGHGFRRVYTRQLPMVPFFGVEFRF